MHVSSEILGTRLQSNSSRPASIGFPEYHFSFDNWNEQIRLQTCRRETCSVRLIAGLLGFEVGVL